MKLPIFALAAVLIFIHAGLTVPVSGATPKKDEAPPNIVLIVSDDQGYADLGCIGEVPILTPNLDRLAAKGVRLTSFYVTWPACTPSRGSLLTGRYPQRNGIYDMIRNEAPDYGYKYTPAEYEVTFERIGGMDTREILIPKVLKSAGYVSGIFGKWDLGSLRRFLPLARGFDDFYGLVNTGIDYYTHERYGVPSIYRNNELTEEDKGTYCTWLFEREAMRFLNEHWERPFFLYLPFNAPHGASGLEPHVRSGAQAPVEYRDMYPIDGPRLEPGGIAKYSPASPYAGEGKRKTRAARLQEYRACVTAMDKSIGSVLDFLDEKKLTENTLVIFFSDNGGSGGAVNTPLRGHKGDTWEGGIRVPFIARWPAQIPAGKVSDEFLTSLELMPTLAAATGATLPNGVVLDGFDMLPVLQGKEKSPRKEMFWQRKDKIGARVGYWKWVRHGDDGPGGLFNLAKDIGEKEDLSQNRPEILEMVQARYRAWVKAMDAAEPRGPFRDY